MQKFSLQSSIFRKKSKEKGKDKGKVSQNFNGGRSIKVGGLGRKENVHILNVVEWFCFAMWLFCRLMVVWENMWLTGAGWLGGKIGWQAHVFHLFSFFFFTDLIWWARGNFFIANCFWNLFECIKICGIFCNSLFSVRTWDEIQHAIEIWK